MGERRMRCKIGEWGLKGGEWKEENKDMEGECGRDIVEVSYGIYGGC